MNGARLAYADPQKATRSRERVGRVVANTGSDVLVLIDQDANQRPTLRVGDVLLCRDSGGERMVAGVVSGINAPAPGLESDGCDLWLAQLENAGTLDPNAKEGTPAFTQNVCRPPALGAVVERADSADLEQLYGLDLEHILSIGEISGQNIDATIDPESLLENGFGIFGSNGSGKSGTTAVILRAMLRAQFPVHVLLIDPHNEYSRSFGRAADLVKPTPGMFPHWLLSFEELVAVLSHSGPGLDQEEYSILEEAIPAARHRFLQRNNEHGTGAAEYVSVEVPLPYRITDLVTFIDKNGFGDGNRSSAAYRRLRGRIMAAIADPRLAVIFGSTVATDSLGSLVDRLFGLSRAGPTLSVLQLGQMPSGLDQLLVSVVCRLNLALAEWSAGALRTMVVIEEAERFTHRDPDSRGGELSALAIKELIYHARKRATTVALVSANPHALLPDVLSNVGTTILHRLTARRDVDTVESLLPETVPGGLSVLGALGPREAIVIGRAVSLSGRITLTRLPDPAIPTERRLPAPGGADDIDSLIARWRRNGDAPAPS